MKKSISIIFVSCLILLSGCSCKWNPDSNKLRPVAVEQVVPAKPAKNVMVEDVEIEECKSCAVKQKATPNCAETVNTMVYRASCTHTCGFPVSVRVPSNCKGSMQ